MKEIGSGRFGIMYKYSKTGVTEIHWFASEAARDAKVKALDRMQGILVLSKRNR